MKASIEFTQGAVLYIIIMLLVIFVGIAIATKGQFLMLFKMDEFSSMFEANSIRIGPGEFSKETSHILNSNNIDILCQSGNRYDVTLKNIGFDYGGAGKRIDFYVVLDAGGKIVRGNDEKGNSVFTCIKSEGDTSFSCQGNLNINFQFQTDTPAAKEFFHFTVWRAEPGVTNVLELPDGFEGKSLAGLLDSQFQNYIGSFDAAGITIGDACSDSACKGKSEQECTLLESCWYKPGFIFGGSCNGCRMHTTCNEYNTRNECKCGETYAGLGCHWDALQNSCEAS